MTDCHTCMRIRGFLISSLYHESIITHHTYTSYNSYPQLSSIHHLLCPLSLSLPVCLACLSHQYPLRGALTRILLSRSPYATTHNPSYAIPFASLSTYPWSSHTTGHTHTHPHTRTLLTNPTESSHPVPFLSLGDHESTSPDSQGLLVTRSAPPTLCKAAARQARQVK